MCPPGRSLALFMRQENYTCLFITHKNSLQEYLNLAPSSFFSHYTRQSNPTIDGCLWGTKIIRVFLYLTKILCWNIWTSPYFLAIIRVTQIRPLMADDNYLLIWVFFEYLIEGCPASFINVQWVKILSILLFFTTGLLSLTPPPLIKAKL